MKSVIYWKVLVNSTKESTVKRLISPLLDVLGTSAHVDSQETYWKNNSLTELNISQSLSFDNIESEIIGVFKTSSLIAYHWYFTLPTGFSNLDDPFSGVAEKTSMQGITWIAFDVIHE